MKSGVRGVSVASRRRGVREAPAVALVEPDAMREHLAPHAALYAQRVVEGVKVRDRTCMRLYGEIMRYVGAQTQIVVAIWQQLGVRDEPEARRLIATARGVDDLDEHGAADLSVKYLDTYRRKFPDRWPALAGELAGAKMPVAPAEGIGEAADSPRTNGGGP